MALSISFSIKSSSISRHPLIKEIVKSARTSYYYHRLFFFDRKRRQKGYDFTNVPFKLKIWIILLEKNFFFLL